MKKKLLLLMVFIFAIGMGWAQESSYYTLTQGGSVMQTMHSISLT